MARVGRRGRDPGWGWGEVGWVEYVCMWGVWMWGGVLGDVGGEEGENARVEVGKRGGGGKRERKRTGWGYGGAGSEWG